MSSWRKAVMFMVVLNSELSALKPRVLPTAPKDKGFVRKMILGGNVGVIRKDLSYMMDVRFYHKNRLQTPNPCSLANGGCSHLCLLAPNTGNTLNSDLHTTPYSCACPTGLVLGPDKRKCNATMKK